jgi:peroxiredoxin
MKKLLYIIFAVLIFISCHQKQTTFSIKIEIDSILKGDIIYLYHEKENEWEIIDSAIYDNKSIIFSGKVKNPELHYIGIKNKQFSFPIYIENSNIKVLGVISKPEEIKISGSKTQDQYYNYTKQIFNFYMKIYDLHEKYNEDFMNKNETKIKEFEKKAETIEKEIKDYTFNYILKKPKSIVALRITKENLPIFNYTELKKIKNNFDTIITNSKSFSNIDYRLKALERIFIGKKYIDFTLKDLNDKKISLSSFIGKKYILLDFWASWCELCQDENQNLLAIYNTYKNKGFDIVAVSLDYKKEDWIKVIKKDGLVWNHVSDLRGWDNKAAQIYDVMTIPHNILIDPKGIIIAKNLRGKELINKISELFD